MTRLNYDDPKFSGRWVLENSAEPDQTEQGLFTVISIVCKVQGHYYGTVSFFEI